VEQSCCFLHVAAADWMALNGFAHAAGLQLLFDLNVLLRNGTEWDSSNARLLLDFSDKLRFNISWQLGNGTVRCGHCTLWKHSRWAQSVHVTTSHFHNVHFNIILNFKIFTITMTLLFLIHESHGY
jgi:hypothetical protein